MHKGILGNGNIRELGNLEIKYEWGRERKYIYGNRVFWVWGYCMAFKEFDRDKGFRDLGIIV